MYRSWFKASGLIGDKGMVNDGLDSFTGHLEICRNNNQTAWTYNQGVIIGALGYLYELTGQEDLLVTAATIANASMTHLVHSSDPDAAGGVCVHKQAAVARDLEGCSERLPVIASQGLFCAEGKL